MKLNKRFDKKYHKIYYQNNLIIEFKIYLCITTNIYISFGGYKWYLQFGMYREESSPLENYKDYK